MAYHLLSKLIRILIFHPDISSDSGFARAANADGMSHSDLLYTITKFALSRRINDTQIKAS